MYMYMYMYMYVYMIVYMYMYMHAYMYTHEYAYRSIDNFQRYALPGLADWPLWLKCSKWFPCILKGPKWNQKVGTPRNIVGI